MIVHPVKQRKSIFPLSESEVSPPWASQLPWHSLIRPYATHPIIYPITYRWCVGLKYLSYGIVCRCDGKASFQILFLQISISLVRRARLDCLSQLFVQYQALPVDISCSNGWYGSQTPYHTLPRFFRYLSIKQICCVYLNINKFSQGSLCPVNRFIKQHSNKSNHVDSPYGLMTQS